MSLPKVVCKNCQIAFFGWGVFNIKYCSECGRKLKLIMPKGSDTYGNFKMHSMPTDFKSEADMEILAKRN